MNEKLYKIFEAIIDGVELTTKNLKDLGYSSNDLNALIKDGSLIRVRRGLYSLSNVDGLLYYGKGLLIKKQYDRAYETFNKCYEIDPNNSSVCFQMLLRAIKTRNYEGAIKLYDKISNTDNEYYNTDAKFYLFLLSLVTELPEEYKDYVNKLSYEDIKMNDDDKRSGNITISNNVRYNAYIGKLSFALKTLNDLIHKNTSIKTHEIIIKSLLHDAILVDKEQKTTVLNLVKEGKYEEAIKFLLNKQCMHRLFSNDDGVLTLLQKLVEIRDTKIVPQYSKYLGDNAFEAIYQNDYETALLLSTNYNKEMGIPNGENSINILLTEICELIKSLSDNKKVEEVKPEEVKTDKETLILDGLTNVVSYLLKKDYDGAYDSIAKYMESINKQKYEVLIKTLIQISILENDISCAKALIYLAQIGNDSFIFNTDEYLSNFYIALSKNRKDIAELYLDIISKSSFFGGKEIDTSLLYQLLDISESKEVKTIIPEPTVIDNVMAKPVKLNKVTKSLEVKEKEKADETYVSKKHDELVSKDGVLLLNQMDEERASRILDIVSTYPDMRGFTIGTGNKIQVVLVHKPKVNKFYDIPGLLKEADIAYDNGDYQKCIDIHLLLLKLSNFPLSKSYIKLGLSYRKLYDKESAIKYLTIADDLAHKEEGNTNDFSNLIFALKGGFNRKEAKLISEIRMSEKEFDPNNMNDYFGFDNFREINDYITKSGLDIESACEKLEMTPEEINILRLVYAREYYIFSNFTTGDLFLSTVEKSKDKTPEIKRLIKEIRESRKFYQTRTLTAPRPTVLVLKPKKCSNNKTDL